MKISEIEKLLEESTPGPWELTEPQPGILSIKHMCEQNTALNKDIRLVAFAPTIIRDLLAVAKAARVLDTEIEAITEAPLLQMKVRLQLLTKDIHEALQHLESDK